MAVVSPSGPVTPENLEAGLTTLRGWGLDVTLLGVYERHDGYLAGPDAHRAAALNRALSGEFEAVFCARGGYGAMRIVDAIVPRGRPWLIGFSDITTLLLRFFKDLPCVHGPVVKSMPTQPEATAALRGLLFDGPISQEILCVPGAGGTAAGPVLAGNLSVIVDCLDADWFPNLRDHVLVLEDVGEADYRLDRLMTALRRSRRARGLRALVLGDFNACGGVYVAEDRIPAHVLRLATEFEIPVVSGFPSGHLDRNFPVLMGAQASVNGSTGVVTLHGA
ncbi:MAG: LD-carboxypeptidase [bacterium]